MTDTSYAGRALREPFAPGVKCIWDRIRSESGRELMREFIHLRFIEMREERRPVGYGVLVPGSKP